MEEEEQPRNRLLTKTDQFVKIKKHSNSRGQTNEIQSYFSVNQKEPSTPVQQCILASNPPSPIVMYQDSVP